MPAMPAEIEPVGPEELHGDERAPYDRLDDETRDEHALFVAYRDLGAQRSVARVAAEAELPRWRVQALCRKHSWTARAQVYDSGLHSRALAELESGQYEMRAKHFDVAQVLLDKVAAAAGLIDPRFLHPRDLGVWFDVAVKTQRISKGVTETRRLEVTGKDGGPIAVAAQLSPEQRRELLAAAHAELSRRVGRPEIEADVVDAEVVEDGPVG